MNDDEIMQIFLSIPMTGCLEASEKRESEVKAIMQKVYPNAKIVSGFDVYKEHPTETDAFYMSADIKMLLESDMMVSVGDYSHSKGCKVERAAAKAYSIPLYYMHDSNVFTVDGMSELTGWNEKRLLDLCRHYVSDLVTEIESAKKRVYCSDGWYGSRVGKDILDTMKYKLFGEGSTADFTHVVLDEEWRNQEETVVAKVTVRTDGDNATEQTLTIPLSRLEAYYNGGKTDKQPLNAFVRSDFNETMERQKLFAKAKLDSSLEQLDKAYKEWNEYDKTELIDKKENK